MITSSFLTKLTNRETSNATFSVLPKLFPNSSRCRQDSGSIDANQRMVKLCMASLVGLKPVGNYKIFEFILSLIEINDAKLRAYYLVCKSVFDRKYTRGFGHQFLLKLALNLHRVVSVVGGKRTPSCISL
jgi:hypothetical protein